MTVTRKAVQTAAEPSAGGQRRGVRLLALAAAAFDADDLGDVDGGTLSEELIAMRRGIDRLEAQFSRRLVRFDVVRGYEREGAADLISWLRWACRMGPGLPPPPVRRPHHHLHEPQARGRRGPTTTGPAARWGRGR